MAQYDCDVFIHGEERGGLSLDLCCEGFCYMGTLAQGCDEGVECFRSPEEVMISGATLLYLPFSLEYGPDDEKLVSCPSVPKTSRFSRSLIPFSPPIIAASVIMLWRWWRPIAGLIMPSKIGITPRCVGCNGKPLEKVVLAPYRRPTLTCESHLLGGSQFLLIYGL